MAGVNFVLKEASSSVGLTVFTPGSGFSFSFLDQETPAEAELTLTPEEEAALALYEQRNDSDVDQSWSLEQIAKTRPPLGWKDLFSRTIKDIIHVEKVLAPRGAYVPLKKDIFNAYHWTPLDLVKVIIIGQDPYHTVLGDVPQAVGASFSTRRDAPLQPSIRNIYQVLQNTVPGFEPPKNEKGDVHGDLFGWARQGVLLLNTCLTTEQGVAGAQKFIWMGLITQTLKEVREKRPYTVVMLWGKHAEKMLPYLGRLKTLVTSHPSPLSARHGFLDCNHFNEANEYLISKGIKPIDWCKLD